MADLIDRQAVQEMVDRIGGMYPYRQIGNSDSYSRYNEAWTDAINRVDAELNSLPSAQPEPCEDAVSREEAKWVVFCNRDHVEDQANAIDELPAVMPKRKTGKWEIYVISPFDGEGCRCSECKYEGVPYWDFCPICGARMEGGES